MRKKILVEKPQRRRLFRIPKLRWEYNIKIDLREIGWKGVEWMHLPQDRGQWRILVNMVMKLWVP
jgi:hypothetical protein